MTAKLNNSVALRRKVFGLTQADLAEKTQVSRKTINTIENAVFVPSTILALRIAHVLDAKVEELFSLPDDTERE